MTRHQPLRRKSPMKRKPSPLRRSRVRPVSIAPKKVARRKAYLELRKRWLAEHPVCELCHNRLSDDVHHKAGRRGPLLTDTRYFASLCRTCHRAVHAEPKLARAGGWLVKPPPQP